MKRAALLGCLLLACLFLTSCALHRLPQDDEQKARGETRVNILLCIFASCHIYKPDEQTSDLAGVRRETPTPSPSALTGAKLTHSLASRRWSRQSGEGDRPHVTR